MTDFNLLSCCFKAESCTTSVTFPRPPVSCRVKVQRRGSRRLRGVKALTGSRWLLPSLKGETRPLPSLGQLELSHWRLLYIINIIYIHIHTCICTLIVHEAFIVSNVWGVPWRWRPVPRVNYSYGDPLLFSQTCRVLFYDVFKLCLWKWVLREGKLL